MVFISSGCSAVVFFTTMSTESERLRCSPSGCSEVGIDANVDIDADVDKDADADAASSGEEAT